MTTIMAWVLTAVITMGNVGAVIPNLKHKTTITYAVNFEEPAAVLIDD
nr:MAG TPA: hypothetical protein [Caudoviricetes sp.]